MDLPHFVPNAASGWVPPPESNGYMLRQVYIATIVVSSVLVFARLGTRAFLCKALGIDDLITAITLAVVLGWTGLQIYCVGIGLGTQISQIPRPILVKFANTVTTTELLFCTALCLVRLCNLAFIIRLSKDKWFVRCTYTVGFLNFAITLVAIAYVLSKCKDVRDLWNVANPNRQCREFQAENPVMLFHASMGIFIDTCMLALPISILFRKMKFSPQMVRVILIFCVGILSVAAGTVRLVYCVGDFNGDTTRLIGNISLWTVLEAHLGLWVACFPPLQPLLRLLSDKMRVGERIRSLDYGRRTSEKPLVGPSQRSSNTEP